jgi:hypothetical protein
MLQRGKCAMQNADRISFRASAAGHDQPLRFAPNCSRSFRALLQSGHCLQEACLLSLIRTDLSSGLGKLKNRAGGVFNCSARALLEAIERRAGD